MTNADAIEALKPKMVKKQFRKCNVRLRKTPLVHGGFTARFRSNRATSQKPTLHFALQWTW